MNNIGKNILIFVFVLTITLAGVTHADNVEIKLGSGDGFKVLDSGGSPLMDILSNGKVGIGVLIPSEKLEVSGNIKATKFIGDGSGLTGISSAWTTGGSDVYYNSGNVGIGTTSPTNKLHVKGDTSIIAIIEGSTDYAQLKIQSGGTGGLWNITSYTDGALRFNSGGERVIFTNTGNVGIGTTSPEAKLHVPDGGATFNSWSIGQSTGASAERVVATYDGGTTTARITPIENVKLGLGSNGVDDRMVISTSGNVGIGTTSPSYTLDVVGDINCSGSLRERGDTTIADYVFKDDYNLPSIEKHADFMWKQKHLPKVSGENKTKGKSYSISERREQVLEELEIAHIYIEQLHQQNQAFEERLAKVEALLNIEQ